MLFTKKPKKLDPKVRFQHKQFTGKLQTARNYKRSVAAVPESSLQKLLLAMGLGSKWVQAVVVLFVVAVLYLLYIPNFLTIEHIKISGLSESQARDLEISIRDQIAKSVFLYPQKNLVFLQEQIIFTAAKNVPSINKIANIETDLAAQTLFVSAESKYERYLMADPEKVYDVYLDGVLARQSGLAIEDWSKVINPSMLKISLNQKIAPQSYQQVFDPGLLSFLNNLSDQLTSIPELNIKYYQFSKPQQTQVDAVVEGTQESGIEEVIDLQDSSSDSSPQEKQIDAEEQSKTLQLPITSPEVLVVIANNKASSNFTLIFDSTLDPKEAVTNLRLLLAQTSQERYSQLNYIDLRIPERAFLCLKGASCAN